MSDARSDDDRQDTETEATAESSADTEHPVPSERDEWLPPGIPTPAEQEILLDAYDLDGDGKVSLAEDARAALGMVDARLQEIAEEGGVRGKVAEALHQVVDKLDND